MTLCIRCYYAKRTTLGTFEPAWTCLHPLGRSAVGYPMMCITARDDAGFCGRSGVCFTPIDGQPRPLHYFRQ